MYPRIGETTHIAPLMVAVLRRYGIELTEGELRARPHDSREPRPVQPACHAGSPQVRHGEVAGSVTAAIAAESQAATWLSHGPDSHQVTWQPITESRLVCTSGHDFVS